VLKVFIKIKTFKELEIWKESIRIVEEVYELTLGKPYVNDFALRDQARKSAISIPSNIAEGFERNSNAEFKRFLLIAKGSLGELRTQLYLAELLKYISKEQEIIIDEKLLNLSNKIGSLIKYLRTQ
jgi:four helix bundle protein